MKTLSLTLLAALLVEAFTPALAAHASGSAAPAAGYAGACSATKELSPKEMEAYLYFNAQLSWMADYYGKPEFEARLKQLVEKDWPRTKVIQVAPTFYERVQNLVDQQRLKDAVARTIGLDSDAWSKFNDHMKTITINGGTSNNLVNPFEKAAIALMKALANDALVNPKAYASSEERKAVRAEAILRATTMYEYLVRWKKLNGDLIDERAAASARTVAIVAVGLVGSAVLCSTLVISGPVVGTAGSFAAGLSTNPVVSSLLVKVAETAAGAAIGFYGAPGAQAVGDAYHSYSEAAKQSANNQTSFSCELDKQRLVHGDKLLSAALTGSTMGLAGGALTFTAASAKIVLYGTGLGVGIAQAYAIGKLTQTGLSSVAFYRLAEEAEERGDHDQALEHLKHARDLAQEAGEHGLEAVIIATLSYHVAGHFKHALHEGESAIRQLYAASADTIPTAERAAENMVRAAASMATGSSDK